MSTLFSPSDIVIGIYVLLALIHGIFFSRIPVSAHYHKSLGVIVVFANLFISALWPILWIVAFFAFIQRRKLAVSR
jgi:ABC-type multidrug transport system fused ATPase/permease subunit